MSDVSLCLFDDLNYSLHPSNIMEGPKSLRQELPPPSPRRTPRLWCSPLATAPVSSSATTAPVSTVCVFFLFAAAGRLVAVCSGDEVPLKV